MMYTRELHDPNFSSHERQRKAKSGKATGSPSSTKSKGSKFGKKSKKPQASPVRSNPIYLERGDVNEISDLITAWETNFEANVATSPAETKTPKTDPKSRRNAVPILTKSSQNSPYSDLRDLQRVLERPSSTGSYADSSHFRTPPAARAGDANLQTAETKDTKDTRRSKKAHQQGIQRSPSQRAPGQSQESISPQKRGGKRGVKVSVHSVSNPGWCEVMYQRGVDKLISKPSEDMYFVRKEEEELKECTFNPKISKASKEIFDRRFRSHTNFFERQAAWEEKRNHWIAVEKAQKDAEERARKEKDLAECTFSPQTTPVPKYLKKKQVQVETEPEKATKLSPREPPPPSSLAKKRFPGCWESPSAPGSVEQQKKVPSPFYPYSPGKSYVSMCSTPPSTRLPDGSKDTAPHVNAAPKIVKAGKKKTRDEAVPDAGQQFVLLAGLKYILDWQSQNSKPTSPAKGAAGENDGLMKNSQQQELQKIPEVPSGDGSSRRQSSTCEDAEGELSLDQQDEAVTSGDDDQLLDSFDHQLEQEANCSPLVAADSDEDQGTQAGQEVLKISDLLEQYDVPLKVSSRASSEVTNRGSEAVLDDDELILTES